MKIRRMLQTLGPALLAGLIMAGSALADELPAITIGAGVVTKSTLGRSSLGAPVEQVTVTHRVSYSDLDLTTQTGAAELRKRVQDTARLACQQLDDLYPTEARNEQECTRTATAQASSQVQSAISAARRVAKAE